MIKKKKVGATTRSLCAWTRTLRMWVKKKTLPWCHKTTAKKKQNKTHYCLLVFELHDHTYTLLLRFFFVHPQKKQREKNKAFVF